MKVAVDGGGFEEVARTLERMESYKNPRIEIDAMQHAAEDDGADASIVACANDTSVDNVWVDPWSFEIAAEKVDEKRLCARRHEAALFAPESLVPTASPVPSFAYASFYHHLLASLPHCAGQLSQARITKLLNQLGTSAHGVHGPSAIATAPSQMELLVRLAKHVMAGEYLEAIDTTYRYFDYGPAIDGAAGNANSNDANEDMHAPVKRKTIFQQYASLSLAQLHYTFGHFHSAVIALQETIKIAQQNKDEQALKFAMHLLFKMIEKKSSVGLSSASSVSLLHRCLITQSNAATRSFRPVAHSGAHASSGAAPLVVPQLDANTALMMAKLHWTRAVWSNRVKEDRNQPQLVWREIERGECDSNMGPIKSRANR